MLSAPPPTEKPKIPPITLERLMEVVFYYLEHALAITPISWYHLFDKITGTEISISYKIANDETVKKATIYLDQICRTERTKIHDQYIIIQMHVEDKSIVSFIVEPKVDKSVDFHQIDRWENGAAYFTKKST